MIIYSEEEYMQCVIEMLYSRCVCVMKHIESVDSNAIADRKQEHDELQGT